MQKKSDILQSAWTYTHANVPSPAVLSHMPKVLFFLEP